MNSQKAFCSWSGGKDSCLALYRTAQTGIEITHLLTMFDETGERSRSHAVSRRVMQAQADALGLKLMTPSASWQMYETVFIEELQKLKTENVEIAVFGDIDLEPHREWEEKVCAQAGIAPQLPLWGENRLKLVHEFLASGFRAVVICVNEQYLSKDFCGREFNENFIKDLPANVDACGENGEFHTFVFDGKTFKNPVLYKITDIYQHAPVFPLGSAASFYYAHLVVR